MAKSLVVAAALAVELLLRVSNSICQTAVFDARTGTLQSSHQGSGDQHARAVEAAPVDECDGSAPLRAEGCRSEGFAQDDDVAGDPPSAGDATFRMHSRFDRFQDDSWRSLGQERPDVALDRNGELVLPTDKQAKSR